MTTATPPRLPPRYLLSRPLGKGGGGEVWAAKDRISGRDVAIKVLAENAHEREVLALVREAVALSGVEGLGVPRVLRFGRLAGSDRSYMVRELVEGESLSDRMSAGGDALDHVAALAQTTDQLARLHRALLLHGDIKPANIIVGSDGRATLVDLGLAAQWLEGGAQPEGLTPKYAAPELFRGAPLTVRAEVFALGATLREILEHASPALPPLPSPMRSELEAVAARAMRADAAERFPSADEFASALVRAAKIAQRPAPGRAAKEAQVWPVVGLDAATARLLGMIGGLGEGGGVVITGPAGSGRSTLLRRIAWSLGVEGRAVAWVATKDPQAAREELDLELAAHAEGAALFALIDDADMLGDDHLERLDELRQRGARLVLVVGAAAGALPGRTFEVFAMPALDARQAGELVRRTIPSLGDAVVDHVVARAGGWPGGLRSVVSKLARAPVVAPADVDRLLLEADTGPMTGRGDIHRLLDRGHFEEAAEVLSRYEGDASPTIGVARARLSTNRGDAARALAELERVREAALAEGGALAASWSVHAARAQLRAGDYAEVERLTAAMLERLGVPFPEERTGDRTIDDAPVPLPEVAADVHVLVADALSVRGLAHSYASRHGQARATLDLAVALARTSGEPRILSVALASLAFALQRNDHLNEAKIAYEAGLRSAEVAGDAGSVATTRLNLASIAHTQGDVAAAIGHLEAAVDMGKRSGRVATLRQALLNLASLELYLGRVARARVSIDELAAERDDLPPHQHAQLLGLEAESAARAGDLVEAERLCDAAAQAYQALGRRVDAAEATLESVLYGVELRAPVPRLEERLAVVHASLEDTTAHRALLALAKGRVATLAGDEDAARAALDASLEHARTAGQKEWIWRALEARSALLRDAGQALAARRDREAAIAVLEEMATRLPRDLREVFWSEPRRQAIRAATLLEVAGAPTRHVPPPGEDRLARVLEINRAIAGELVLERLLEKVTDHAIALLRAERGFVILRSGYARAPAESGPSTPALDPAPGSNTVLRVDNVARSADADADTSPGLSIHAVRGDESGDPHARFSKSIAERVIRTGETVVSASARDDARMADYLSVHQLMLQSIACVPIRARTGQVIGALYLETRLRPAASFADEIPTLVALADQVAIAIETARLVGENERRARELERTNGELVIARARLEELLGHRTAQLVATRRDLRSTRAVLRSHFGYEGIVGTSEAMRRVYALIDRVKDTDVPVLIIGESGTGKEMVARALHNAGPRSKKAFVGINCGAIPEHLLESELFGHVKGAFTGADRDRKGLFREATEGTILLDEIGEMPQKMQAGLLRVLQERLVRPVGGAREEPVDTRVIAATHRDLASMVADKTFREDLFYRLNVISVRVPPLRERLEDIPILIDHFLGIFAARYGRERRSVARPALKRLAAYGWPGNVRQLENVLLNAWVLSEKDELEIEDFELPDARPGRPAETHAPAFGPAPSAETSLEVHKAGERERILEALASCNWNRVKAAQVVGLPRRTFYRRLKEYGIQ